MPGFLRKSSHADKALFLVYDTGFGMQFIAHQVLSKQKVN